MVVWTSDAGNATTDGRGGKGCEEMGAREGGAKLMREERGGYFGAEEAARYLLAISQRPDFFCVYLLGGQRGKRKRLRRR